MQRTLDPSTSPRPQVVSLDLDRKTLRLVLEIPDAELWALVEEVPESAREEFVRRALKVGLLALRDARVVARADYVEKEFQRMRAEFQEHLNSYFGPNGQVTQRIHQVFGDKGHLDQKLKDFLGSGGNFDRLLDQYLGERGRFLQSLEGSVGAQGDLRRTLDGFFGPQGVLKAAMDKEFGPEGGRLFQILNPYDEHTPLGEFRKELDDQMEKLREEVRRQFSAISEGLGIRKAEEEALAKSSRKGLDFEEQVVAQLLHTSRRHHDKLRDVRNDRGRLAASKAGDFVCDLDPGATGGLPKSIVLDAKNTPITFRGKESIFVVLDEAMKNRDAHFGIAIVERSQAPDHPPLQYYAPDHVVVTVARDDEDSIALATGYDLARALLTARGAPQGNGLDPAALQTRVNEIERALQRFQALLNSVSGAERSLKDIRSASEEIRTEITRTLATLRRDASRPAPGGLDPVEPSP